MAKRQAGVSAEERLDGEIQFLIGEDVPQKLVLSLKDGKRNCGESNGEGRGGMLCCMADSATDSRKRKEKLLFKPLPFGLLNADRHKLHSRSH